MEKSKARKRKSLKKTEIPKIEERTENRYNRQLKWIFISMGIIAFLVLAIYLIMESSKKFEYGGLSFEKIMYDKLPLYYSRIPIKTISGQIVANYNLYLRNDPRELDIPVNGTIRLMVNSILSVDESIEGCSDNGIAGVTLGTFFKAAGINMIHASTNKTIAEEKGIVYATCEESEEQTVIILRQAEKTEIVQERQNCYIIEFKDCEIVKAIERFIVATSAHSKGIVI